MLSQMDQLDEPPPGMVRQLPPPAAAAHAVDVHDTATARPATRVESRMQFMVDPLCCSVDQDPIEQ